MTDEPTRMEFSIPGVTTEDPRDQQLVLLREELTAAYDRIAELEDRLRAYES